jgi:hypothetical protein
LRKKGGRTWDSLSANLFTNAIKEVKISHY